MGKKKRWIALLVILNSFGFASGHASLLCEISLSSSDEVDAFSDPSFDETDRLIAYMESLLEEGVFEEDHLSSFISGLEKDRVLNPLQDQEGSAAAIQGAGIQEHIDRSGLDKDRLLKWARLKRAERNRIRVVRNEVCEVIRDFHHKMEFHSVRVGSFQMGKGRNKKEVTLTYPIEVMSTQVTQMHWVEIMGENPSEFAEGEDSMNVVRDGKMIILQPDHPVENITWWSILVFANRLSEEHGLTPTYDLSGIAWEPDTKAENGTLEPESGKIKIRTSGEVHGSSLDEFYYQAEGFRLPTDIEQEYMLRAAGTAIGKYHFGDDEDELKNYAWYKKNSEHKTHSVAQLAPLILDGKEFYDLLGNVSEYGWDHYHREVRLGASPVESITGSRVLRGGSWFSETLGLHSSYRHCGFQCGSEHCGFRLVRTIKNVATVGAK